MLRDVSQRKLSVHLFDDVLPAPILLAPIGAAELVSPDSDVKIGQAAADLGVPYILSCQGCNPMEEVASAMERIRPGAPRWF